MGVQTIFKQGLVPHPARNRTRPWAGFPHGCVIGLALRKSRSKSNPNF